MNKRLHIVLVLIIISVAAVPEYCSNPNAQDDDTFRWETASEEVESFPFTQAFIDSVKREHHVIHPSTPLRKIDRGPLTERELMVFDVSWGFVRAGYLVIEKTPQPHKGMIRVGARALSNNFVSAFFRIRDYVISHVDAEGLYPLFFEQHLREGNYKSDGYILYDPLGGQLFVEQRRSRIYESPTFVHDYLSIICQIRSMKIAPGDTFTLNLFMSSRINPMLFRATERKEIKVDDKTYNCIKLVPRLVGDGKAFNRRDRMEVWFTDDEYKIPVYIRSRIKVGSVNAKLVHYERG